ncbi:hypothetical protein LZG00_09595 [Rhodobacteraceae bacterium LMO-12]|nr:hypothetical protein [Rhodobacteraceae bacterium LMO-JJ12]
MAGPVSAADFYECTAISQCNYTPYSGDAAPDCKADNLKSATVIRSEDEKTLILFAPPLVEEFSRVKDSNIYLMQDSHTLAIVQLDNARNSLVMTYAHGTGSQGQFVLRCEDDK